MNPPRYVPSGFFISRIINPITLALGGPALIVKGRKTGQPIRAVVPPFAHGDGRYLVSGGGETHWVRNLRAAGTGELRARGKREEIRAIEVVGDERDSVVAAYRDAMGPRASAYFKALPNLADHPVFRVEVIGATG